jgi:hypothetical protein
MNASFLPPALAFSVSILIGYGVVRMVLQGLHSPHQKWLEAFLSPGIGFALTVFILFADFYVFGKITTAHVWFAHAVLLAFVLAKKPFRRPSPDPAEPKHGSGVVWGFVTVGILAVLLLLANLLKSPYGTGVDVWALWKLKARFLFYDDRPWEHLFQPVIGFSCLDYPLFYPLLICWGWLSGGAENLFTSWAIVFVFTLSLVGLPMAFLLKSRRTLAFGVGLFLISVPHFIGMASSQYAELILAYFMLASVILIILGFEEKSRRYALLGGFCMATAAFVKNEGLLYALVFFSAVFLTFAGQSVEFIRTRGRILKAVLLGIIPVAVLIFLFKWRVGVPNEKMSWALAEKALHSGELLSKTAFVIRFAAAELIRENAWVYSWIFIFTVILTRFTGFLKKERLWLFTALLLLQAGFVAAYLISPLDLERNLRTSLDRLLFDSFPVWVFLVFWMLSDS